jgi:hypothetical protein
LPSLSGSTGMAKAASRGNKIIVVSQGNVLLSITENKYLLHTNLFYEVVLSFEKGVNAEKCMEQHR